MGGTGPAAIRPQKGPTSLHTSGSQKLKAILAEACLLSTQHHAYDTGLLGHPRGKQRSFGRWDGDEGLGCAD